MINFDLQNHKPLREIVYEELKRQIMTGEIAPGTRMMEVELAEEMGVSRTPIREAIRKLEKEGLVTIEARRGAYASEVSIKEMVDVLEVREFLEGMAAGLAALKITEEDKAKLHAATTKYKEAVDDGDIVKIVEADVAFHKIIAQASANKTLLSMLSQVQELSLRFRYIYYDNFSAFKQLPSEHKVIVDSILAGDSKAATSEMTAHISKLKNFVIENDSKILTQSK